MKIPSPQNIQYKSDMQYVVNEMDVFYWATTMKIKPEIIVIWPRLFF
jgi:hypothetical protein